MDRAAAIDAASVIDQQIEEGIDPQASPRIISPKPTAPNALAFENLVPEFLKHYKTRGGRKKGPVKPKTYQNGKSLLTGNRVSKIKNVDVRNISRAQIIQVLDDMADTPYLANRLHSYLSVFFNWCWNSGYIDSTPMYQLEKLFRECNCIVDNLPELNRLHDMVLLLGKGEQIPGNLCDLLSFFDDHFGNFNRSALLLTVIP